MDKEDNKVMATPDAFTLQSRDKQSAVREVGFVAQEVEALVQETGVAFNGVDAPQNETAQYGLRYASFVVPLVKAVQEQQAQIELLEPAAVEALHMELQEVRAENATMQQELVSLQSENESMREQLDQILVLLQQHGFDLESGHADDPGRAGSDPANRRSFSHTAQLEQNAPNPFRETTTIRYFLPDHTMRAQLVITDLQGNRILTRELSVKGQGEVIIEGGSLASGTYVYSLVVDGRMADSKQMVLL